MEMVFSSTVTRINVAGTYHTTMKNPSSPRPLQTIQWFYWAEESSDSTFWCSVYNYDSLLFLHEYSFSCSWRIIRFCRLYESAAQPLISVLDVYKSASLHFFISLTSGFYHLCYVPSYPHSLDLATSPRCIRFPNLKGLISNRNRQPIQTRRQTKVGGWEGDSANFERDLKNCPVSKERRPNTIKNRQILCGLWWNVLIEQLWMGGRGKV